MIEPPQIVELVPYRLTAVIHVQCTCEEIQQVMGRGVRELLDTVREQGVDCVAPLYTHHLHRPTDRFEFEIGVPVSQAVMACGRVRAGAWPHMRVVRTVHHGRYEDLRHSWSELRQWIETRGLQVTEDLWECYLTGPERGQDARQWRTELIQPLAH